MVNNMYNINNKSIIEKYILIPFAKKKKKKKKKNKKNKKKKKKKKRQKTAQKKKTIDKFIKKHQK